MKEVDEIESEEKIWVGHLYLHYDETDELPPPFIYLP